MAVITYNGRKTEVGKEKTATMHCGGKIALTDIVAAFSTSGSVTYNGVETEVEAGKTATLLCKGMKMLADVIVTIDKEAGLYDANDNLIADWDTLVNTYGVDVERDYYGETNLSPMLTKVIENNSELSLGTKLIIGNSVTRIGEKAVCDTNLTNIVIPNSVTSINRYAFIRCHNLAYINIPNSVTYISSGVFTYCEQLNYNVDDGALYLGNESNPYHAFMRNITINDCVINKNTKVIADYACWENTSLKSLLVPGSIANIPMCAFATCKNLTTVTIGDGVLAIGDSAFSNCDSLTTIRIPDSVTSIGMCAFVTCENLTSVTIGNGVTIIDGSAFHDCDSLADVYYRGTKEQWAAITIESGNDKLKTATIHYNYTD